jgi:hypothetical protein
MAFGRLVSESLLRYTAKDEQGSTELARILNIDFKIIFTINSIVLDEAE